MDRKARRRSLRPKATLSAFAAAIIAATVAAGFALDASLAIRFPYLASLAEQYARQTEPVVLSLGSSRTSENFDVNLATSMLRDRRLAAFNAAVHGSALTTQEEVLETLLESGKQPALVTVEINPEFLHRRLLWVHMSRDVTWSNLLEVAGDLGTRRGSRLAETRVLPLYARRNEIRRAVCKAFNGWLGRSNRAFEPGLQAASPVCDGRPLQVPQTPSMTDALHEKQRQLAPEPLVGFSPTGSAVRSLERMLANCQGRGIPVLMIDAPVCSLSRAALAHADVEYCKFIASMLHQFPTARYFDAKDALPDFAFADQHHANEYGRFLMSKRLAGTVIPETLDSWHRLSARAGGRPDVASGEPPRVAQ